MRHWDITQGNATVSPITAANIRIDKFVLDGTELTVTSDDFKSGMNGGVFDNGNPINGYGGNIIEETSISSNTVSFNAPYNTAKRVEVTFTIEGLTFKRSEEIDKNEATALDAVSPKKIYISEVGSTIDLIAKLTPFDTDSTATFYSSDESIVWVDNAMKTPDANGDVYAQAILLSEGSAKVTVTLENGLTQVFEIIFGEEPDETDPEDPTDPEVPTDPTDPTAPTDPEDPTDPDGNGNNNDGEDNPHTGLAVIPFIPLTISVVSVLLPRKRRK